MEIKHDIIDGLHFVAVIDGKELHTLYTHPNDNRAWTGDMYAATVMRYAPAQRAYFLDLGNGVEAFLPHRDGKAFDAGKRILIQIERPATADKAARVSLKDETCEDPVGLVKKASDILSLAKKDFPEVKAISEGLSDFDAAIQELRSNTIELSDGIHLIVDEIAALTAIDINSADPNLNPLEVNRRAAIEIARQLRLRNLNKQILVDFLRIRDRDQKFKFHDEFYDMLGDDPREVRTFGFTRLGLFELTRVRHGLSLAEAFKLTDSKKAA
jgi:ribonuclease G